MKSNNKIYENRKQILFLLIFSLGLCAILFLPYTVRYHDIYFHLARLESLVTAIHNGDFFPRIFPYFYDNFGYAVSLFYSDFFLYIPAVLCLLGVDILLSYKIYNFIVIAAISLSAYYCAEKLTEDKQAALVTSIFYTASSYLAVDVFVRGALGETQAFVFLPFCILGMYNAVYGNSKDRAPLIIGFSGLVLSHNLSLMLISVLFAVFLLLNITKLVKEPKRILEIAKSSISVVLLTAFFLFPMAEQLLKEEFFSTFHARIWNPGKAAIRIRNLFIGANLTEDPVFTPSLGITMLIAFIICAVMLLRKPKNNLDKFMSCMTLGSFACVFASTSLFPWYPLDPYLNIIQFPSRFFTFVTLFLSFGVGIWWSEKISHKTDKFKNILLVLISVICFAQFQITTYEGWKIAKDEGRTMTDMSTVILWDENYLNGNNNRELWRDRENYIDTARGVSRPIDITLNRDYYERHIEYSGNSVDNSIEVAAVYFLGYRATDDLTGENLDVYPSDNGWLEIDIGNSESGQITVDYYGTFIQHISPYISLIFIIGFIAFKIYCKNKK